MKKVISISLLSLLVVVFGAVLTYGINSDLVGNWVHCADPNQHLEFEANGRYHAVFEHSLGWVDTYGSYDVDESANPNEVYYTISTIYIDGQQGRVGPSPGDEISGIWKVEGDQLTITINDDPWGDPPSSFGSDDCYKRQ